MLVIYSTSLKKRKKKRNKEKERRKRIPEIMIVDLGNIKDVESSADTGLCVC